MNLKKHFCLCFLGLTAWGLFVGGTLEAKKFFPFEGRKTAWYFSVMEGAVAVGLKGPFATERACWQKAGQEKSDTAGDCYSRETVEYFQWRQNQLKTWVLPVKTGELSRHLVFTNRKNCHRVAESGFFITATGQKALQPPDLKYCILTEIYFDEAKNRYAHWKEHPLPKTRYPKRYKAWSLMVEEGRYGKLLQFRSQQQCERVAKAGQYFSSRPRAMFATLRVVHEIPKKLRKCVRRTPQKNEVPVIYQHTNEHSPPENNPPVSPTPQSSNMLSAWRLTIEKPGGAFSLFFKNRKTCLRVARQRLYYQEISRGGWFPSKAIPSSFEKILEPCAPMKFSEDLEHRFYPFGEKH